MCILTTTKQQTPIGDNMNIVKDRINKLKARTIYFEGQQVVVFYLGYMDLGNNFTLYHFYDALSIDQLDLIYEESIEIDATILFRALGNYGTIELRMTGSDHMDFFRSALRKVKW